MVVLLKFTNVNLGLEYLLCSLSTITSLGGKIKKLGKRYSVLFIHMAPYWKTLDPSIAALWTIQVDREYMTTAH